ncbi:ornithine carbamoyltransferase [Phycisphaeraceae bacterium D3-23]
MTDTTTSTAIQHFLSIRETSQPDLERMFDLAFKLRDERNAGKPNAPVLQGKTLGMFFEKPSLRTRVSFEQGMLELGGNAIVLGQDEVGLGQRESVADFTRVMNGMVHGIAARVYKHEHLVEMAQHATVPVVNMLSEQAHPAQALADAMTLMDEFGRDLSGKHVVFVGDGNNVARSLAMVCGKLGASFTLASPPDYAPEQAFADRVMAVCPGMDLTMTHDPASAMHYADAVYADTFVSMGDEDEHADRHAAFAGFQVNDELLSHAPDHAVVLHCLPAHRGEEITDVVMDGPRSRVFPQAHNRLHAQKGLLAVLMG